MFYQREAEHEEEPEEDFVSFEDGSDEESDGQDEVSKTYILFFLLRNFSCFYCSSV